MGERIGRKAILTWDGDTINCREKGVAINGEGIDITQDNDDGVRTMLSEAAELGVDLNVSGLADEAVIDNLKADALTKTDRIKALTLTYGSGAILSGNFYLESFNEGEPYKEGATFDAVFKSSGAVSYTPAP